MEQIETLLAAFLPAELVGRLSESWPWALLGLSLLALMLGTRRPHRPRRRWRGFRPGRQPQTSPDPRATQLAEARAPDLAADPEAPPFKAYPVLNAAERRLHVELERLLPDHFHPRARLLAQVSLSEFVFARDKSDFLPISSSRVDYLIVDSGFQPICAIEYQGAGHHGPTRHDQSRTRQRDFDKRRALRMAGVPLVEIPDRYDLALLRERLGDVTGRRQMAAIRTPGPEAPRPRPAPLADGTAQA
jgi:hypothetical protein